MVIGKLASGKGHPFDVGCIMMVELYARWECISQSISIRIGLWCGLHTIRNSIDDFNNFACDRLLQYKWFLATAAR